MSLGAAQFKELLDEVELKPMSYSGRGMYGAQCIAVVVPPRMQFQLGLYILNNTGFDDLGQLADELQELLGTTKVDDFGKTDVVLYWPELAWPEDKELEPV